MARGWCSITVGHELEVAAEAADPEAPGRRDPVVVAAEPRTALHIEVIATNHLDQAQEAIFRLVGLGPPLIARATTVAASERPERRSVHFDLPDRLDPGRHPVALEWIRVGDGRTERLAVTDLIVVVEDISQARVELTPTLSKGLLGSRATVLLENNGDRPLTMSMDSSVPMRSGLSVEVRPERIRLEPGRICSADVLLHRRTRWVGANRDHVFDVHAHGNSGVITTTGTFRQRSVLPPWLFKVVALIAVIGLATWVLLLLVRAIVDDEVPPTWESTAEAPVDVGGRIGHSATWMTFDRRDASGGIDGAVTRLGRALSGSDDSARGVFIWGGEDQAGRLLSSGGIYSVTDGEWLPVEPLPSEERRRGHTAVWTGDRVVIWGGLPVADEPGGPPPIETAGYGAQYDPTADQWDDLPPSGLAPRRGHSLIWTGRELIVFGGVDASGNVLGDGGILRAGRVRGDGSSTADDVGDLAAGVWSRFELGDLSTFAGAARTHHSASYNGAYMVITGGIGVDGGLLDDAYAYDVGNDRWSLIRNANFEARACHRSVAGSGTVYVLGGFTRSDVAAIAAVSTGGRITPTDLCASHVGTDRRDPAAWAVTVEPDPENPTRPLFDWGDPLADVPEHLGSQFVATWTGTAIGIAMIVEELDTVAPILYVPGAGTEVRPLPAQGQLDVTSDLTAAWRDSELFVWGGRREAPCGDDALESCHIAGGALIDVAG